MIAIKINATVNLLSGLTVAAPSFLTLHEAYFDNRNVKDTTVTAQFSTGLYITKAKALKGKNPIVDIADYTPTFLNVELPLTEYSTKDVETLALNEIIKILTPIYTAANLSIVNV